MHIQFKELNSQLNREVLEFERAQAAGTHHFSDADMSDVYMPSSELEAEAQAHVLGAGSGANVLGGSQLSTGSSTREEMRRRVLQATMDRLRKEEEELEHHCGTSRTQEQRQI